MHPTTERTVDKPDKRFEEGGAAERIKSIREANGRAERTKSVREAGT